MRTNLSLSCLLKFKSSSLQSLPTISFLLSKRKILKNAVYLDILFYEYQSLLIENDVDNKITRYLNDAQNEELMLNEYPTIKEVLFKFNKTHSSSAPVESFLGAIQFFALNEVEWQLKMNGSYFWKSTPNFAYRNRIKSIISIEIICKIGYVCQILIQTG